MTSINSQRLCEAARPGAQKLGIIPAAASPHGRNARKRLKSAYEDGGALAAFSADQVEAPVQAVGPIDIGDTRRSEHRGIPRRFAPEAMRCRVHPVIGLRLDDEASNAVNKEPHTDKRPSYPWRKIAEVDTRQNRHFTTIDDVHLQAIMLASPSRTATHTMTIAPSNM